MLPDPFPAFRSVLRPDALVERVLAHYTLGDSPTCQLYNRGINDVYIVRTAQGRWVLRVTTANGSTPAAVQSEVAILRHLAQAGIAVAPLIARRDGAYITVLRAPEGERSAVLFDYVEQAQDQAITPERAAQYGASLARMHAAAETFPGVLHRPPHDYAYFVEEPLAQLNRLSWFAEHPQETAVLRETADSLWSQTRRLPETAPCYGFCHGDAKTDNALFSADGTLTLIDFDYGGLGWRVYDLATYIWLQIVDGPALDWSKGEIFRALLAGYQSIRPLSAAEIDALPVFAALRQVFLFGRAIMYSPVFGVKAMTDDWLARMVAFIEACRDGDGWLARVGLR